MANIELEVAQRKTHGKGPARRLRAAGLVPGNYYAGGVDPVSLEVAAPVLARLLRQGGATALLKLKSKNKALNSQFALLRELQTDPIKDTLLHFDLQGVRPDEEITIEVPLVFVGTSAGEQEGGRRDLYLRELEVACRADSIPSEIEIDITELELGDILHIADLTFPDGVRPVAEDEIGVVGVELPKKMEDLLPVAEEEVEGEEGVEGEEAEEGAEEDGSTDDEGDQ